MLGFDLRLDGNVLMMRGADCQSAGGQVRSVIVPV